MNRLFLLALACSGASFLLSACAPATAPYGYDYATYDVDGDGFVEYTEYYDGYRTGPYYGTFDADGDGFVTDDEFGTGLNTYRFAEPNMYGTYDLDGDGMLNEDEFYRGAYGTYDLDGDGVLDRNEFDASAAVFTY